MKKIISVLLATSLSFLFILPVAAEDINGSVVQEPYGVEFKSNYKINGTREKVTADFVGPTTITTGEAITTTSTWSGNVSVSIKSFIIQKMDLQLGISYSYSSSSQTQFSATFAVESGKIGAVYFTPYIHYIYLKLTETGSDQVRYITIKTPYVLNNGFTDGLYELIQH